MQESTAERTGTTFRLRRRFDAPREKVFRAWTEPEALRNWWCPTGWLPAEIEIDLRAGGSYRIGMRRASGGAPVCVRGSFLEVCVPEKLSYTWQWENAFDRMPQTRVTVEFLEEGEATAVILTHENLPEIPVCLQHRAGWIAALGRIAQMLSAAGPKVQGHAAAARAK